jgi:hypothetical protein
MIGEAMQQAPVPPKMERFEDYLRPLVQRGERTGRKP